MSINGFKFRYINLACYEIILPNGKVIVVDPCIDMPEGDIVHSETPIDFKKEDFIGADYIIVSHTHGDHTLELGYLTKKFNSKVIVGALSAFNLAAAYDLSTNQVYPCFPNEKYVMEDFIVEVFRGQHVFGGKRNGLATRIAKGHPFAINEYDQRSWLIGSMEYCDYLITTKENIRIFICGGLFTNVDEIVKKYAPNIVLRQSHQYLNYTPEEYGRQMGFFGAQLCMPLHQDELNRSPIECTPDQWFERANAELQRIGSSTQILNPKPLKWYKVSMSVTEE